MSGQNSSSLISQVYQSRLTLIQLMKFQGFNTTDHEGASVNEVNTMKNNNQLDMIMEKNDEDPKTKTKEKVYIKYYLAKALRPDNLQQFVDQLYNTEEVLNRNDNLYIVVKDKVNDTLRAELKDIWAKTKICIIIVPLNRLLFNILEHVYVPPHRIMKEDEVIAIRRKYNIMSDEQFPELSRFDPVAQAIGIRPGQVCEIMRPSKTGVSAPYYRMCVS